jgi:hypothetical protein
MAPFLGVEQFSGVVPAEYPSTGISCAAGRHLGHGSGTTIRFAPGSD